MTTFRTVTEINRWQNQIAGPCSVLLAVRQSLPSDDPLEAPTGPDTGEHSVCMVKPGFSEVFYVGPHGGKR